MCLCVSVRECKIASAKHRSWYTNTQLHCFLPEHKYTRTHTHTHTHTHMTRHRKKSSTNTRDCKHRKEKRRYTHTLSWRTNEGKLLCLKNLGITFVSNNVRSRMSTCDNRTPLKQREASTRPYYIRASKCTALGRCLEPILLCVVSELRDLDGPET